MIRLALVDRHVLLREALKHLLDGQEVKVVESVDNLPALCDQLDSSKEAIDIVLFNFDDPNVLEEKSCLRLEALSPDIRYFGLTSELRKPDPRCDGLLSKDVSVAVLKQSLVVVMLGQKVFPPQIFANLCDGSSKHDEEEMNPGIQLSERESVVMRHIALGHSNKVIARELDSTETAVKAYVRGILRKFKFQNRTQAAIWAVRNGFLDSPGKISTVAD